MELIEYWKTFPQPIMLIDYLDNGRTDCVISWGFPAQYPDIEIIIELKKRGFKLIWFDGDRNAALNSFIKRETEKKSDILIQEKIQDFNNHVHAIDSFNVISKTHPVIINPFDDKGLFRQFEEIIIEILS